MQKEWSSFRITLILYLVVLILPLSFYFVYTSFKTMQHDTKIVRQSSWVAGGIECLTASHADQNNQQMISRVDKTLREISPWVTKNSDSKLYIGTQTLSKDFSQANDCWTAYKEGFSKHNNIPSRPHSLQCYQPIDNMAIIIEKMVYLKQNKIINIFYLSLLLAMILILLTIYMTRTYIHTQMKKHAIHDHETKLFNKKYFLAELKATCASSARHNYPLSMLYISIDDFEKENQTYDKKIKTDTLEIFGALITSAVRTSDIACRYDENHFLILLPFTEDTLILEERIRHALQKDDWMISKNITFNFTTTQFDKEETGEAFIVRTLDL